MAGTSLSESSSFEMARASSSEFAGKDSSDFSVAGMEDFTDVTLPLLSRVGGWRHSCPVLAMELPLNGSSVVGTCVMGSTGVDSTGSFWSSRL